MREMKCMSIRSLPVHNKFVDGSCRPLEKKKTLLPPPSPPPPPPHRDLEHIAAPVYSAKAHDVIVNAIDGCGGLGIGGGAPELVTGSRDGETADKRCKV